MPCNPLLCIVTLKALARFLVRDIVQCFNSLSATSSASPQSSLWVVQAFALPLQYLLFTDKHLHTYCMHLYLPAQRNHICPRTFSDLVLQFVSLPLPTYMFLLGAVSSTTLARPLPSTATSATGVLCKPRPLTALCLSSPIHPYQLFAPPFFVCWSIPLLLLVFLFLLGLELGFSNRTRGSPRISFYLVTSVPLTDNGVAQARLTLRCRCCCDVPA